jgi:hypothetical protein
MSDETVDWNSEPAGMMKVYQGQNYDLGQSISDLVDNGIDEGADTVEIVINPGESEENLFIAIFDNGSGIAEYKFDDIMKLGHSTKTDASKLGVFGVGLKLSSLAQADEVTIQSQVKGHNAALRRISAPYVLKNNVNKLMKVPLSDSEGNLSAAYEFCHQKMLDEEWSTFVLLEKIHAADQFVAVNENYKTSLTRELKRVIVHLGLTFHRILETTDIKIEISTGGRSKQSIQPLHPGMPRETDLDFGTVSTGSQTIAYDYKDVNLNVKVEYIILPHVKTRQHKSSEKINHGYKRAADMQGLYIYRNGRLIQYGGWQQIFGGGGNRNDPHATYGKIFIDIPSDHIKLFGLNPTKTEVKLPKEFLRRLLEDSKRKRKWGPINGGKEITFFEAFDKRYRGDGNAFKKRKIQAATGTDDTKIAEEVNPEAVDDPQARVRAHKKKLKAKKIITSLTQNGSEMTLTFAGTEEEQKNFIEAIKEWRANE